MLHRRSEGPYLGAALSVTLLVLLMAGCGRDEQRFPDEVADNFLRACRGSGGTEAACRCALAATERRFTLDEYRALEGGIERGKAAPPELLEIAEECGRR